MGYEMKEHEAGIIHKAEKQADFDEVIENCPRVKDQIRSVRFHHRGSKGPVYARSFIRKVLGNEGMLIAWIHDAYLYYTLLILQSYSYW